MPLFQRNVSHIKGLKCFEYWSLNYPEPILWPYLTFRVPLFQGNVWHMKGLKRFDLKFELPGTHITTILNVPGAFVSKKCFTYKRFKLLWIEVWTTRNPYYNHVKRSGCLCLKKMLYTLKVGNAMKWSLSYPELILRPS